MRKIILLFIVSTFCLAACDLQPKISAFPDNVGDFISTRYPALLADPDSQPEIYNSAASDYGVYQSLDVYGTENASPNDYMQYASPSDYQIPAQPADAKRSVSQSKGIIASVEDYLTVPDKKTDTQEIVVEPKDTLYSISRRFEIPVNDLAVMNELKAPFALSIGQKLKVPSAARRSVGPSVQVYGTPAAPSISVASTAPAMSVTPATKPAAATPIVRDTARVSSTPTTKLPTIAARSSSKFSWPVRGKILSGYGSKPDGLFNDGINIGAQIGTSVSATDNGVVAYAGNEVKGMGNLIIIQHANGWMSVYAHLDSMNVRRGHKVSVGQKIGSVGQTGKVSVPQLHFELRKGTKAYDPQKELKK